MPLLRSWDLGSLILTHKLDGEVKGLKDFPADQRPPVAIPFFAFRIMVGCATLMFGIVLLGGWLRWRGRLTDTPSFLLLCQLALTIGVVAVIAGWAVTEVGRQPWTVYGLLRTAASVSPSLTGRDVVISLLALYGCLSLYVSHRIVSGCCASCELVPRRLPKLSVTIEADGLRPQCWREPAFREEANHEPGSDFVPIWTLILGTAVFFYVLLDGFDLGVGILYGLAPNTAACNTIMNSIAPIWDGNEILGLCSAGSVCSRLLPARVRHHHSRRLFSNSRDAACTGFSRCGVRVPLPGRRAQNVLGPRVQFRIGHCNLRARHGTRQLHPGIPDHQWPGFSGTRSIS